MLGPIFEFFNLSDLFSLAGRHVCGWERCMWLGEMCVAGSHVPVWEGWMLLGGRRVAVGEAYPCVRALDVPLYN